MLLLMVTTCSHFCSLVIHDKAHQDNALKRTSWTSFKIYSDYETENVVGHVKPITLNYEEEGEEKGEETGEECNREEGLIKVRCLRVLVSVYQGSWAGLQDHNISQSLREKFKILVCFDHDCLKNKLGHAIFFQL